MTSFRYLIKKKTTRDILKFVIFIIIVNLPYLTIIQQIGLDAFVDSFEAPEAYHYSSDIKTIDTSLIQPQSIMLIQKISDPSFSLKNGDVILYYEDHEGFCCNKISGVSTASNVQKYYLTFDPLKGSEAIPEQSIIGKVVGTLNDNIWNSFSLLIWETTINNLNIRSLYSE
jgi:hypothetical protein